MGYKWIPDGLLQKLRLQCKIVSNELQVDYHFVGEVNTLIIQFVVSYWYRISL